MYRIFHSLRFRIIALVLLALLPALALAVYTGLEQRRLSEEEAAERMLSRVRDTASDIESLVANVSGLLMAATRIGFVRETDPTLCAQFFNDILTKFPMCTTFTIALANGSVLFNTTPYPRTADLSNRPWFRRVLLKRELVVGEQQVGPVTGKPSLPLVCPILEVVAKPHKHFFNVTMTQASWKKATNILI